ncbi:LuxR C-terminal-related transcriptional regulator [Corticibacter populi]|nr:response regulator transcription factor [Corticibacter populi]RZS32007.1 LuxR family two component transcriptional regulator [Corticibacter populi]
MTIRREEALLCNKHQGNSCFTPSQFARSSIFDPPAASQASPQARATRILVVDDDAWVRQAILAEFERHPDVMVVGEADSHARGAALIRRTSYDILLVDLNLGDGSGFELLALSKSVRPISEVVIISVMEDLEHAFHAFELGATGYLVKNGWIGNFTEAVLQVAHGGAAISPNLARRIIKHMGAQAASAQATAPVASATERPVSPMSPIPSMPPMWPAGQAIRQPAHAPQPQAAEQTLSGREQEILRRIAEGLSYAEIAQALAISTLTVNTHIKNIYRKLQVNSKTKAIRHAMLHGLV